MTFLANRSQKLRDFVVFLATLPVFIAVSIVSSRERAFLVILTIGIFHVVLTEERTRGRGRGFWALIASFAALHVIAILLVPLPESFRPALAAAPVAILDALLIHKVIAAMDRRSRAKAGE